MGKRINNIKQNFEKILNGEITIQYGSSLRRQILQNKTFEYKCNKCGIKEWNDEKITLEIEHKDGNNYNNKKENLEFLCPNCHSQTKTYKRKKTLISNTPKPQIPDGVIIKELEIGNNLNQTLLRLKLSNSGGNYRRLKNIIKTYNLEEIVNKVKREEQKKNELEKQLINENIIKTLKGELKFIAKNEKIIKISNFEKNKNRIQLIKDSDIDFNLSGWGKKLGGLFNMSPFGAMNWMKKELPEFYKNCFKHN